MTRTDRLGATVSVVMLGLALSVLIPVPSRELTYAALGAELTLRIPGMVQYAAVAIALLWAGVDTVMRTHPRVFRRSITYTVTFWVLPGLLTLASLFLLRGLPWWGYRMLLVAFTGLILSLVIVLQYRSIDPSDGGHRSARVALNLATYATALVLYAAVYGFGLEGVLFAIGVFLVSGVLALELLRDSGVNTERTWLYSGLSGILMGELAWALSYWSLDAWMGAVLLLLVYYTLTGLMQQHFWERLSLRVALEYAGLCALGLATLGGLASWFQR